MQTPAFQIRTPFFTVKYLVNNFYENVDMLK